MAFTPRPLSGPVLLRIAADALVGATDYADDQIWEMERGGEPPALALTTTYGHRAARMRIYPSFGMGGPVVSDPTAFTQPEVLDGLLPSYLSVRFAPLEGLDVRSEVRVVDSHTVAGRMTLTNSTNRIRPVRFDLHGLLNPLPGGQGMLPRAFSGATALAGQTGGLQPVLFLTGGALEEPGLTAGLVVRVDLAPGAARSFSWGQAALASAEASFDRARSAAGRAWEAEVARLERTHDRWVDVSSGDADWDAAFHLAQQTALASLIGPGPLSGRLSIVQDRAPDCGYSPAGDGRDYGDGWVGPSALEAYAVLSQIVWAAPEAAADALRGFFESQGAGGEIDACPGPAGQRSRQLAPPLLAPLALKVDEVLQDRPFLEEAFRSLWLSFRAWSRPSHDRDGDGWPEWDGAGHPPWPLFWSRQGPDDALATTVIEDPALAALLSREAEALQEMAERLGRSEVVPELQARRQQLRSVLQRAWDPERLVFRRIERDTHRTPRPSVVASGHGSGSRKSLRRLSPPSRLTLRVATQAGQALDVQARVRGRLESGRVRVESFGRDSFRWMPEAGAAVSQLVFATVESVEVHGVPESMAWEVSGLDLDREDLTLLLPLWAGVVERAQAETILRQVAMAEGRFLRPFGLATIPCDDPGYEAAAADPRGGVHPTLNLLLGEAMVRYGLRAEAAELLQRSLRAGLDSLRRDRTFWQSVHPETGEGLGRRHAVRGAPPLSLLLDILGVGLRSPDRVRLEGRSAFDHPVVVRWRGLEIERSPSSTRVRFADEQSTLVEDEAATLVERVAEPEGAGRTT